MTELRPAKLVSATLLVCAGAVCVTIGGQIPVLTYGDLIGFALLALGIPMLVRQWTGRAVLAHLRNPWRQLSWTPWLANANSAEDESIDVEARPRVPAHTTKTP